MIVVQLFRCLLDEYTEHLFIFTFFSRQKSDAGCVFAVARFRLPLLFFDCHCVVVSLISAFHLFL